MDKNQKPVRKEACPYLGLRADPDVRYGFPSPVNVCFRGRIPTTPAITHQDAYCLSGVHDYCPVFLKEVDRPPSFAPTGGRMWLPAQWGRLGRPVLLVLGVILVGLVIYASFPQVRAFLSDLSLGELLKQALQAIGLD